MGKRLVYGVGINDADYEVTKREKVNGKWKITWICPYYTKWTSMLMRCYSEIYQEKRPTYKVCTVCEEWLTFSIFKRWMELQAWEGRTLDKDFLIEGNKVYSPTTCVFITNKLNAFITTSGKARGLYPIGVCYKNRGRDMVNEYSKPYGSGISYQGDKQIHLGYHPTPEEAHQAYLKAKLEQCYSYLVEFKGEPLIIKGLTRIKNKIQYHTENSLELTSF